MQRNYVNPSAPSPEGAREAAAFSHFTYDRSGGELMVIDIQGSPRAWTDPQVHSKDRRFGAGDLGESGMEKFFATHACNELCAMLDLKPPRKECVMCLDRPREYVLRPCGHFCLSPGPS